MVLLSIFAYFLMQMVTFFFFQVYVKVVVSFLSFLETMKTMWL